MDPSLLNEIHSAKNTLIKVQKIDENDIELKEELYIGNLHHQSRHHNNNHCWTMFISKSPTDVVSPITIKCVTYHLHQTFRPRTVTVQEPPFYLSRRGWGYFSVKADITFKSEYYASKINNNNDETEEKKVEATNETPNDHQAGVEMYINPRLKKKNAKPNIKGLTTIRAIHSIHFGSPIASHHIQTNLPYIIDSPSLQVLIL